MRKKTFFAIVITFLLVIAISVPVFAASATKATMYNTSGKLCNLYGKQVYSAEDATINGTVYENSGKKFFHNDNGTDPTSIWVKIGNDYYFAGSDCYFVTDTWVKFGSKDCYLDKNGKWVEKSPSPSPSTVTGWKQMSNGKWRYYNKKSTYLTGWQQLEWSKGTNWFYFDSKGYMYANAWTPDGFWVDANGAWDGHDYRCIYCGKRPFTK